MVITITFLTLLIIILLILYILERKKYKIDVKKLDDKVKKQDIDLASLKNTTNREKWEQNKDLEKKELEFENFKGLKEKEIQETKKEYALNLSHLKKNHNLEESNLKAEFKKKAISKDFIEASLGEVNEILKLKYTSLNADIENKKDELNKLKEQIELFDDEVEILEKGVYQPRYDFSNAMRYERKLTSIRDNQKLMMQLEKATTVNTEWRVENSKSEGKKLTSKYIKQILRSFNSECDVQINKVTYKNIKTIADRINSIYISLNKLYKMTGVEIKEDYLNLKVEEMYLAYEYAMKKNEEKEFLKHEKEVERERKREERLLNEEIKEKKQRLQHEMSHFKKLLKKLNMKLDIVESTKESESIYKEIQEVQTKIEEKKKAKEELDFRESHLSAGYVYIISNIGAFGKDVVKIGVTRRLEPYERIKELSSASVPFTYDVHALIFSYKAFELEKELHTYFDKYRINKVNARKEFFRVSIDEIEKKLKDYGELTINFNRDVEAIEYYQSQRLGGET